MWNNQCDIVGNLTRDPEVKTTSGGRVYARTEKNTPTGCL